MRRPILALWLFVTAMPAAALTHSGALTVTRTEVTLALDGPVTVKAMALTKPDRLVVDLAGVDAARISVDGPPGSGVARAKLGQFDATTARLVLTLARPLRIAAAQLDADGGLVLGVARVNPVGFAAAVKRGRAPLAIANGVPPPRRRAVAPVAAGDFDLPPDAFGTTVPLLAPPPRTHGRKPLVVIDAGHGGKDVGAIALNGRYEKDATLAIALAATRALATAGKVRVRLTRTGDSFVPLGGRVAIARTARADLFVSVHADSAPNPQARGASVYTLSDTASDAVAARLAARENKADIIGGVDLGVEAPEVGDVMIALVRRNTLNTAIAFAETLQAELADRVEFRGEFHHFAGFVVLKVADVPSVLLETGYLSNADDAALLFSRAGQKLIGEGIARAVERQLAR